MQCCSSIVIPSIYGYSQPEQLLSHFEITSGARSAQEIRPCGRNPVYAVFILLEELLDLLGGSLFCHLHHLLPHIIINLFLHLALIKR